MKQVTSIGERENFLKYREFRNFSPVIEKAKEACTNSGQSISEHFVEFHEAIVGGNNAVKEYSSVKLSRYACYLIVQNADPNKKVVALGQTYFAVQTRLQEIRRGVQRTQHRSRETIVFTERT